MDNNKRNNMVDLMETTMTKIRDMVDVNTIVGQPITTPDGVSIIPVSRLSFGFGSAGSDYGKETKNFAGGGGAGVNIVPIGFLIIQKGGVKMLPVSVPAAGTADRLIEMAPSVLEKIEAYLEKRKQEKEE